MAGKFLRGAFVEMMQTFLVPIPNVIIFQYNPETITHTWTPAQKATPPARAADGAPAPNPLAVQGNPGEAFSFTLAMDATDMLADGSPVAQGIASVSGIYTRIAALEMLLYPTGGGGDLLGSVSVSIGSGGISLGGAAAGVKRDVPPAILPTVLFVWGPGRILPVKVTSLAITEKLYDKVLLNPTHAEAQIGLQVLTPEELNGVTGPLAEVAKGAYVYSQGLRQALAIANLANSVESAIGMLPL
jgi:hypothetical protein